MSIYKESVLDIIDNWGGYPLQPPPACEGLLGLQPAINAGVVEIKCFINNTCPFFSSPYKEDGLVFSEATYNRIKPWLPDDLRNALSVTQSLNGIHFTPKYVFRHGYIYQKYNFDDSEVGVAPIGNLFDDFNNNYREASQIDPSSKSSVVGVDKTKYMEEQSWVVAKSIFDPVCTTTGVEECDAQAEWGYIGQKVSNSSMEDSDLAYDYNLDYYGDYVRSWEQLTPLSPLTLIPGQPQRISKNSAQMPVQKRVRDYQNRGVHWRLIKRTPLFQGEDFFIRFYKQADDTVSNPNDRKAVPFPPEFQHYWPLDITRNDKVSLVSGLSGIEALERKRNFAISPPTIGNEQPDNKKFDFHDQAYYIIELGMGSHTDNYFIVITERANPIFVNFVKGSPDDPGSAAVVSKKFSEFEGITGEQLIHADWFDITVRNHLGALVVQFRGDGIQVPPWVIKRLDWIPDKDPVSGEPYLKDKVRTLFVPRGQMSIMGGNLRSGFIFGPLQYETPYVTVIYPPREQMGKTEEDMKKAFNFGSPEEIDARSMQGAFKSNPFFLPSQGEKDILFSSTDIFLQDLGKHVIPVGEAQVNQPLFMQDSQYYSNYYESDAADAAPHRYGGFLYDDTIRDFSDMSADGEQGNTSYLVVKKYRYLDDPKTRQQAFDVLIGMMAGDHIFTQSHWSGGSPAIPGSPTLNLDRPSTESFQNDEWFVPACKTPILASLRLIANEGEDPRWDDGTNGESGINSTPESGTSSYFIDATDHVMGFSDSWSTSSFSEMEHTGTLNFYLNRGMPVENNVTDALLSLQNKTFYVEIWAGYTRPCVDGYSSYTRQSGLFKLFTGLCHGGKIDYQYGKNIMSCKIEDYTAVLKGSRFFNSPWFDGVKDINCIREIMQMCGFRDEGKYDPGKLIKYLSDNSTSGSPGVFFHHFDGRLFKMEAYALPSGYNRLDQPAFKFNDGDPFMDAVVKIAKRAGKVFFFDQHGIAHYENFQDIVEDDYLGRVPITPLYYFTTNPEIYPGQLIFDKLERSYDVQHVTNHLKIMSNTPDFYLLIGDELNWSSMDNPESEGFIGYLKSSYQQEGMFGSKEAMMETIRKYSVSFRPKIHSKFETYGVPMRANDIIQINGENTRVMKVNHLINAEKNVWWMEVETEKYQVISASRSVL